MSSPNLRSLPNQPDQTIASGFTLLYFFRQWTTLATVINAIVTYLNSLVIPSPTPPYVPAAATQTDVTGSRSFGTTFTNLSSTQTMQVTGWGNNAGSATARINFIADGVTIWSATYGATVSGGASGFTGIVLPGKTYEVTVSGDITGLGKWVETLLAV